MSKVTSKYQVTLPKAIAERYGIEPGDNIDWVAAGDVIRVVPLNAVAPNDRESRLHLFDQATKRLSDKRKGQKIRQPLDRGWRRADLYDRGRTH